MLPLVEESRWDPETGDLVIGALRVMRPPPPSPTFTPVIRDIRASPLDIGAATTLFRSVQHGHRSITLTHTATVSEDGILYVDVKMSQETGDHSISDESDRLWDTVLAIAAPHLASDLASAIGASVRMLRRSD